MPRATLNRRQVLRGAGTIAIALPWLEAMGPGTALAAGAPARRFVAVYTPGGTVYDQWKPSGTESAFTLGPILAPLDPMKSRLLVLDGLTMKSAVGEQHQAGIIALLTGTRQNSNYRNYSGGPSVDQVIAARASVGKAKSSLQLAIRWATGSSQGTLHPINALNFENSAGFAPIPPRLDPQQVFKDLFGSLSGGAEAARLARRKSILDFVDRRYVALGKRVGTADRQKLDQHLTKVRELEKSLEAATSTASVCQVPPQVDTSDYNPFVGASTTGATTTDAAIPKVGKFMIDMLVMALACDMTGVGTLQWTDTEAKHTFPWLGLSQNHHYYQHDGGFRPTECASIYTWYSRQHLLLLDAMAKVDMGGHSLLDESVVFFGSELSDPPSHSKSRMPFLLAGGGGLRTGRWLQHSDVTHNNLLVTLLNLFGDPRTSFGDAEYCTGALPNLV
jgi:hypothetical protein